MYMGKQRTLRFDWRPSPSGRCQMIDSHVSIAICPFHLLLFSLPWRVGSWVLFLSLFSPRQPKWSVHWPFFSLHLVPSFHSTGHPRNSLLYKLGSLKRAKLLCITIYLSRIVRTKSVGKWLHKVLIELPLIDECSFIIPSMVQKTNSWLLIFQFSCAYNTETESSFFLFNRALPNYHSWLNCFRLCWFISLVFPSLLSSSYIPHQDMLEALTRPRRLNNCRDQSLWIQSCPSNFCQSGSLPTAPRSTPSSQLLLTHCSYTPWALDGLRNDSWIERLWTGLLHGIAFRQHHFTSKLSWPLHPSRWAEFNCLQDMYQVF